MTQKPVWWLIFLLAAIKFLLPFLMQSPVYELQRDELLYFQQGQHLALGYLENPPFLSWLAKGSAMLGSSKWTITLWPAIFGSLTVIVTCFLTAEFGGKIFAQLLAGISVSTGAFLRVHALFQPNMLDIFFWTLSIYFLIRFLKDQKNYDLCGFVLSLALGAWSKYSIAFLMIALVIALMVSPHRKIFLQRRMYIATLLFIILILPNLYWQYSHNFPLLHHMAELQETQLQFNDPLDFIKDQFLMNLPAVFVWPAAFYCLFKNKEYRFIIIAFFIVMVLLLAGNGKSYYALGIYPVLFAAGGMAWEQFTNKIKWMRLIIAALVIFLSWLILPMALAIWEPAKLAAFYKKHDIEHKWEDLAKHPLPQDFADMLGWKELAEKSQAFYFRLPDSIKNNMIIFCGNYGQAGGLLFKSRDKMFNSKIISASGSFLLWIPEDLQFKHLLMVTDKMPEKDHPLFSHFGKISVVDSVTNVYSRQFGNKIIFYQDADNEALQMARKGLEEEKKKFSR